MMRILSLTRPSYSGTTASGQPVEATLVFDRR
jgi:hypothetical protein